MPRAFVLTLAAAASLCSAAALAQAPSDASIEELLRLVRAEATTAQLNRQLEPVVRSMMAGMARQQTLTAPQQRALERFPARLAHVLQQEYGWAQLKPQYLALYREVYSQDEIDGQIAFYRTPAGQAVIAKQPVLAEKALALSMAQMQALLPRLQAALRQTVQEARAEPATGDAGPSAEGAPAH